MTLDQYIDNINRRYKLGNATEHTFRGDLQQLLESLVPSIRATNEPKRQICGAPDYILTKNEIPVGFIEAKDLGDKDLEGAKKAGNKEQFDRYKTSLNNIIFTDYLDFHLYRDGQFVMKIAIGEISEKGIKPLNANFSKFENFIKDFCTYIGQNIRSSKKLAEMMAGKARLLSDVIEKALTSDESNQENSTLKDQMNAFKQILIHDITPKGFADVYAQTIAYGMFAARYHDPTLPTFSRQEAFELIPKSNPFLKKLFGYIAGLELDERIKWIVDDLVQIFLACNVEEMLKSYGKATKTEDPIIHFYEDFLSEYDPKLRKARGVWYTPAPVVNFIVRAVDDILKTEFNLPQGLADTSKTKINIDVQGKKVEREVHKVQILDPATGTGTFLAEVVKQIYKKFEGQQGIWSNYVETHLLPRLNGFELLMASYAMAHLKLDLLLTETGYKPTTNQRFRVYLTNSLEESHPDTGTLFANWLSTEANEANHIKRDTPVMCIIGNPPYSVSSSNKSEWIEKLTYDYKRDLNERNIQPLSDDYIKFIRFGQHFIDKNGSGVLAYISNNSFIDGTIHRQMRKSLLESFDKIYILDLHGNSKKNEVCPDGSFDQNVFDIMQGVSINIFVKTGEKKKNEIGQVFHFDLQGKRNIKFDFMEFNSLKSVNWNLLFAHRPDYKFTKSNYKLKSEYELGFSLKNIFLNNNVGFTAARDSSLIHFEKNKIDELLYDFENLEMETIRSKYQFGVDSRDWTIKGAIDDIKGKKDRNITQVNYRPFDYRFSHYSSKTKGFFSYPRWEIMQHFIGNKNIGLIATRLNRQQSLSYFWISNMVIDRHILDSAGDSTSFFPLYQYPEKKGQQNIDPKTERMPNLNLELVNHISEKIELPFTNEKEEKNDTFAPIDILDYIYAVLHSPSYREKYKEFLKSEFPRVPYPKDKNTFWQLVNLGSQIRQIHLLESPVVEKFITQYPIDGNNIVTKPKYQDGKVYINETQYFSNVPQLAWEFYIGGYQPAQKWLKDRKDRKLEFDDILHYQKIIVALSETERLMNEVNKINIE
ncbi:MAG: N-6 DNA methylase [Bacteroidetes bacterium]|nr:N-6 DNA methylase [Bacteroidota bacterium]